MMKTELEGDWISAEQSVGDEIGQKLIAMGALGVDDGEKTVSLSVSGDESSFTGMLAESQLPEYFELVTQGTPLDNVEDDSLPDDFFERLSERQRIFIQILLEHDEPVTGPDIREEMRSKYDQEVSDSGSGTAGIISGITRKYGKDFRSNLLGGRVSHHNDEGSRVFEHWIGDKYEEELRDYFDM
jgi:hypothetical protein